MNDSNGYGGALAMCCLLVLVNAFMFTYATKIGWANIPVSVIQAWLGTTVAYGGMFTLAIIKMRF